MDFISISFRAKRTVRAKEDNDHLISMKILDLMRVAEHEYFLVQLAKAELVSPTSDECFVIWLMTYRRYGRGTMTRHKIML